MSDEVWRRAEVQSPCVKICVIHPETGLCVGCNRTGDEIAAWPAMTPEARRALMAELPDRQPNPGRRGGRKTRRGA